MPDLTVQRVAVEMGVHEETIRRWLKKGRIAGYQPGGPQGAWRIAPSEVERLRQEDANDDNH